MDEQSILNLNVKELQNSLRELNLSTAGRKAELQNRLLGHFGHNVVHVDDDASSTAGSSYEDAPADMIRSSAIAVESVGRSVFTFKDIEESLTQFSGNDSMDVRQWVNEFEENAAAVGWNGIQKFIYSKQLLRGAAKLFIRSQRGILSWELLKEALILEFGSVLSASDVHNQLRSRRKKSNETFREYLYALMEIGKNINIDAPSIISYFIDGIPDSRANKMVLYQAKSISELKEQIKIYEKVYGKVSTQVPKSVSQQNVGTPSSSQKTVKPCFRCGSSSHLIRDCNVKQVKCFKCQGVGHKSFECTSKENPKVKKESDKANIVDGRNRVFNLAFKTVAVGGLEMNALIDTGCCLCLIRRDIFDKLNFDGEVNMKKHTLYGVCKKEFSTYGSFVTDIVADGLKFSQTFHITSEDAIEFPVFIGTSVLGQVNISVTPEGVTFTKREANKAVGDTAEREEKLDLLEQFRSLCMNVEELSSNSAVCELIENYEAKKVEECPMEMKILLQDEVPVFQRPRRLSKEDKEFVDAQVQEWLEAGIIQPSFANYASPIVIANKKDGSKRLCCDYRLLNKKIIRDNFPMARIDDVLDKLQGAYVFTTLDLADGFFHVPVQAESRKYTSFVTPDGQYEFKYVPFGICNSPAVFCRFISFVFRELIKDETIAIYMDDVIIPAVSEEENITKLRRVLEIGSRYGLRFKWKKCQFLERKINFLGYEIENGKIRPSTEKIEAIRDYPLPRDKKGLERFLGLTSYFRRFMNGYALIAKPLSDLLKKERDFEIGKEQLKAFNELKTALTTSPVLSLYNVNADTEIHTDASKFGYGAIFMQKGGEDQKFHPVQFLSRKTTKAEENYTSYELEVLAIIAALKKWRIYLKGIRFTIITDCNAFACTMRKDDIPPRVARWALLLQEFNYQIQHRSGTQMRHVDALSRMYCLQIDDSIRHRLMKAQLEDEWTKAVRTILEEGSYEDFYLVHGILCKDPSKELLVVPKQMEDDIIKYVHEQGHFAARKTQECVEKSYYIPEVSKKVARVVNGCVACIIANAKAGKKEGFLNPIPKDEKPLSTYHLDHLGPLTATSKQYNYILAVVDAFSKFVWLYPTKDTSAAAVIDRLERQAAIFGNPRRVITDRGAAFTSQAFSNYCSERGVQHLLIATGVPRGNGQVERIHRIVVPMLTKLSLDNPDKWYQHVAAVQQFLNNSPSRSTKAAPFNLLTGLNMRLSKEADLIEIIEDDAIKELDKEREEIREMARDNIKKVQEENKKNYNAKRKAEKVYKENDMVAIRRTQFGPTLKLKGKYLGPYKIIRVLNHGRYEVEKIGEHEGPNRTTTVAEYIKMWSPSFRDERRSGRPIVGLGIKTRSGREY